MQPISRILCPCDFSDRSAEMLAFAERLAASLGAEILLLHVFDTAVDYSPQGQKVPIDPAVKKQLDDVKLSDSKIAVRRFLHLGIPGEVICWLAEHEKCDLIVMGTHGRTGISHLLVGSVAEYVVRHARCPVLTVRSRPVGEPPLEEPLVRPLPPPRFM